MNAREKLAQQITEQMETSKTTKDVYLELTRDEALEMLEFLKPKVSVPVSIPSRLKKVQIFEQGARFGECMEFYLLDENENNFRTLEVVTHLLNQVGYCAAGIRQYGKPRFSWYEI